MDDITEEYRTSLADLTQNSKPLINMLTMLAEDNEMHAAKIVEVIETHLQQVDASKKLPTLYLIDSIIKNLPKSTYPALFSHNIVNIFCSMFEQVDEKKRQCMFKVRQTWNDHFPSRKLYALDVRVNHIDNAWPLSTPVSNVAPSIHVNPRFLSQREETLPLPDLEPVEDDEAEMRRQLIAKQAELLKLQQKRLELELKETESRLAQQKKTSADLFVGIEQESEPMMSDAMSQNLSRDPRLRDPRTRDPRVCRDPRMRNKPVAAELLPEVQPVLTFFGPVTNQPLNQFGQPGLDTEQLGPPLIVPESAGPPMLPNPMPTAGPMPPILHDAPPPMLRDFDNQNNQAIPVIKEEPIEHKHIHSPKKEFKQKPHDHVKPVHSPVKVKIEKDEGDSHMKVKLEKHGSISPKDKKHVDHKKSASEGRSKESRERETSESKLTSSRASHSRTRNSNSDSKSHIDSKERGKSRNKDDQDKGKSQNDDRKERGNSSHVDNQRGKGKRTRGDSEGDNRKRNEDRNGGGDGRDKGKNWNETRSRRSKSPRPSRERSRSPLKDSLKGKNPKSQTHKSKSKTETGTDKKPVEDLLKKDLRKPISSLPRIPKRSGADVDDRSMAKDKDERRLSASNKRDLDERHDYRDRESERNSKKPRLSKEREIPPLQPVNRSQERDIPPLQPVNVNTKINEDISALFGSEDQDYRHPDTVSPRGGGWARYKADHPQDFDNRRNSLEDVDHRREAPPRDTDYRPAPFNRPPGRSPGFNEQGRGGLPPVEQDIPQELRLENRETILRTMEMRRKSGDISHDELQTVLRDLSQFDSIQEQRRHSVCTDPPQLEMEIHNQRNDRYPINRPMNEPPKEFHSPVKDFRNHPQDADMRRDDRQPIFDNVPPLDISIDRNRDILIDRNRDSPMDRNRDIPMDRNRDIPMDRNIDVPMDRNIDIPMDRDIQMGISRDIPMGMSRDIPMGVSRDVLMDRSRDSPLDRNQDIPIDKNLDLDERNRNRDTERHRDDRQYRGSNRLPDDRDTYRSKDRRSPNRGSDRHSYRGIDRAKVNDYSTRDSDQMLHRVDDGPNNAGRPIHMRGRDFEGPDRPSLLGPGPGPRLRPEQEMSPSNRDPVMQYDIDHRKPPLLDRGPQHTESQPPEVEPGRSPVDKPAERPVETKPSLLGPGPANLKEKEKPPKKVPEKAEAAKEKKTGSGLAVGAMLEMLRSEHTPENSQDVPENMPKTEKNDKKDKNDKKTKNDKNDKNDKNYKNDKNDKNDKNEKINKNYKNDRKDKKSKTEERKAVPEDVPVPILVPKPIYDPNKDDRWILPDGSRVKDEHLNSYPEGTEEVVINRQPYPVKLGGPKISIIYKGEKLDVFLDPSTRNLLINGSVIYKVLDPVKEVRWGPGPNNEGQVFYHGYPRNLWIDGFLYNLRIDAPPKIISFRGKNHTVSIDGRDGMILIDKKEFGLYGGKPRFERLDGERVELRFTPPPKNIVIDGEYCQIMLDRTIPFILLKDVARGIRFDGPPREVIINNVKFIIPTDRAEKIRLDNVFYTVAFGGPSHELIINGNWFEMQFNGPPRQINIGGRVLLVGLPTPPPDVKILDPIESQKLKDDAKNTSNQSSSQKQPISILDLNVPKPPGLKDDRRRGSPTRDKRSRSPDRHRDRRRDRRSPHRDRRSPDRRRRRSPKNDRDDRGRGSPNINDLNGPPRLQSGPLIRPGGPLVGPQGGMPIGPPGGPPGGLPVGPQGGPPGGIRPFIPDQQGPNPQFPQNQPFPQPNQGFPPNQRFPGPNQPPFPQGPDQRFPSGPNPMFPGGPNQPFPQGPNQQMPPGPNQQMPPGPNQQMPPGPMPPMQQFPPQGPRGPLLPLPQDEGSQGPHPMFQPGPPNPQFPPGQNIPMQPNPNMPVMSQPMPIQPMPMMRPVLPPVSSMNPPIIPGSTNPPQDTIPGMIPQPPTLQPELNVQTLIQKLINAGLINKKKEEEAAAEKEEKKEETETETPKEMENNDEGGKEKRKPVRIKPQKAEKVPDLTEMKSSKLRQQYKGVIQRMYSGIQCTSCGTRFMASQTRLYREHLDWHFRQNLREKRGAKMSRFRSWFYELDDWFDYEEVGDAEERAHMSLFEQQAKEHAEKESALLPQGENIVHCPAASGEDAADACVVCGDVFEQFFDEESEAWHLKNALRSEGKTYHPVCYEDAQEKIPKVDPGADPMLLQIQKELGYVPSDTVVSFPAANVISVSQHDHTPKDIEIPTESDGESEVKEEAAAS